MITPIGLFRRLARSIKRHFKAYSQMKRVRGTGKFKVRVFNETRIPSGHIHDIVRFAMGELAGLSGGVNIYVLDRSDRYQGYSYPSGRIEIGIPSHTDGSWIWNPRNADLGYQKFEAKSFEDGLVYILSHELRHQYQFQFKRGLRTEEEKDSDIYALGILKRWKDSNKARDILSNKGHHGGT